MQPENSTGTNQYKPKPIRHHAQLVRMAEYCMEWGVLPKAATKVFVALASHWSPNPDKVINPSRERLAALAYYKGVRNITKQTRNLKELGLIDFGQRRVEIKKGVYKTYCNIYQINISTLRSLFKEAVAKKRKAKLAEAKRQARLERQAEARYIRELAEMERQKTEKNDPLTTAKNDPPFKESINSNKLHSDQNSAPARRSRDYVWSKISKLKIQAIAESLQNYRFDEPILPDGRRSVANIILHARQCQDKGRKAVIQTNFDNRRSAKLQAWKIAQGYALDTSPEAVSERQRQAQSNTNTIQAGKFIRDRIEGLKGALRTASGLMDGSFTADMLAELKELATLDAMDRALVDKLGLA